MSGIFGIVNVDGQPIAREQLEAMRDGMAFWGLDGSAIYQSDNVGLGHLLLCNTPEARYESLPRRHPASGVILTAHARLDNRDELLADCRLQTESRLKMGQGEPATSESEIPDGDLILFAYLRWGAACVHHLIGDWAFALWDPRERKLFIARDHGGISSIYYYRHARFFAFASSIKALLALPQVPKHPNLFVIARLLTVWPGDGTQIAYEEIFRLPPAHTLTVAAENVETRRYWFLENTPLVRLRSDDEYQDAFLEIYSAAVRCCLRTANAPGKSDGGTGARVGATLSSGLDSGSVCALAARELYADGQRLSAFTAIPMFDTQSTTPRGWYGDEAPLVECNRQFIGNLDVHYIRAENVSPLAGIVRGLELHDRPMHAAGNMFWIYATLESAQRQGLGVLLTGQDGNATISWMGSVENFWLPVLTGQWQTVWRKHKRSGLSPWKTVKRHLLRPIVLDTRRLVTRSAPVGVNRSPWAANSAINVHWARSLDLTRQMKASGHGPFSLPPSDPKQVRCQMMSAGGGVGALWAEMGPAYGLEVRAPTMDKRLIEFCLAIPDEQYRVNGQDRALIRRAMKGLLPDEVRLNTGRGLQAADLGYRLLAELPQVQAVLAQVERSELAREVLDLAKMKRVLHALQKEVNGVTTDACMSILARGLMVGLFLLRFDG